MISTHKPETRIKIALAAEPSGGWVAGLMAALAIGLLLSHFAGWDLIYRYLTDAELKTVSIAPEIFTIGGKQVAIPRHGYAVLQYFVPDVVRMPWQAALGLMVAWLAGFSAIIVAISYVRERIRFYLLTSLALAAAFFLVPSAAFFVEGAGEARIYYICLALSALAGPGCTYFFKEWRPETGAMGRYVVSLGLSLCWLVLYMALGQGPERVLLLAGFASPVMLVGVVVAVFQLGYVLPFYALRLAIRQSINGAVVFVLAILFLAGNLVLAYLHSRGMYEGTFIYTNAYLVLGLAAVFGLPVFKYYVAGESNWYSEPGRAGWAYVGLVAPAIIYLIYSQLLQNSPALEVAEDLTNLFFAGLALAFGFYVIINFAEPLAVNKALERVLLEPRLVPVSAIMAIGATLFFFVFASEDKHIYDQANAAYYLGVADGYYQQGQYQSADVYYLQAAQEDRYTFRANYMLAQLAKAKKQSAESLAFLKEAVSIKPEPIGFVDIAAAYRRQDKFFDQVFALQEGLKTYPADKDILNNLTLALAKTALADSAAYYEARLTTAHGKERVVDQNLAAAAALRGKTYTANAPGPNSFLAGADAKSCNGLEAALAGLQPDDLAGFTQVYNGAELCGLAGISLARLEEVVKQTTSAGLLEDLTYLHAKKLWSLGLRLSALEEMQGLARPASFSRDLLYSQAMAMAAALGSPSLTAKLYSEAKAAKVHLPEDLQDSTALARLAALSSENKADAQAMQLLKAIKDAATARKVYEQVIELAPFSRTVLLALEAKAGQTQTGIFAFEALSKAYAVDKASPRLAQAYIRLAQGQNLTDFAQAALDRYEVNFGKSARAALQSQLAAARP